MAAVGASGLRVRPARASRAARARAARCEAAAPLPRRAALGGVAAAAAVALAPSALAKVKDEGVYFIAPDNNATVTSPFTAKFGVKGLEIRPAAEGFMEGTGHHHLLVDLPFVKKGEAIPFDEQHLHYGKGQTEASIELPPGKHTLTLQFANATHKSYGKGYSKTITVNVK